MKIDTEALCNLYHHVVWYDDGKTGFIRASVMTPGQLDAIKGFADKRQGVMWGTHLEWMVYFKPAPRHDGDLAGFHMLRHENDRVRTVVLTPTSMPEPVRSEPIAKSPPTPEQLARPTTVPKVRAGDMFSATPEGFVATLISEIEATTSVEELREWAIKTTGQRAHCSFADQHRIGEAARAQMALLEATDG